MKTALKEKKVNIKLEGLKNSPMPIVKFQKSNVFKRVFFLDCVRQKIPAHKNKVWFFLDNPLARNNFHCLLVFESHKVESIEVYYKQMIFLPKLEFFSTNFFCGKPGKRKTTSFINGTHVSSSTEFSTKKWPKVGVMRQLLFDGPLRARAKTRARARARERSSNLIRMGPLYIPSRMWTHIQFFLDW